MYWPLGIVLTSTPPNTTISGALGSDAFESFPSPRMSMSGSPMSILPSPLPGVVLLRMRGFLRHAPAPCRGSRRAGGAAPGRGTAPGERARLLDSSATRLRRLADRRSRAHAEATQAGELESRRAPRAANEATAALKPDTRRGVPAEPRVTPHPKRGPPATVRTVGNGASGSQGVSDASLALASRWDPAISSAASSPGQQRRSPERRR